MEKLIIIFALITVITFGGYAYYDHYKKINFYQICYDITSCPTDKEYTFLFDNEETSISVMTPKDYPRYDMNNVVIKHLLTKSLYRAPMLVKTSVLKEQCKYVGIVAPFLDCGNVTSGTYDGLMVLTSYVREIDPEKYLKAIETESKENKGLIARYMFNLALYYDSNLDTTNAKIYYKKRIELEGWAEEMFYSHYRLGVNQLYNATSYDEAKISFMSAYHIDPYRKEPLYYLARIERDSKSYNMCLMYTRSANGIGVPRETALYVDSRIYDWGVEEEHAICLYYTGHKSSARYHWKLLLDKVPEERKQQIHDNLKY